MDERTLEDRVTWLEAELTHTREFSAMLLSFLSLKGSMPLDDFATWCAGWFPLGPLTTEDFSRHSSIAEIRDRAAEHLESLAGAEDDPEASPSMSTILARIRSRLE